MVTAPEAVRAAARYVAASVEEDGAASLIEALVLTSPGRAARNAARMAVR
jgi:hydroxymethylpyrimidine pyrophosphatase-like HAD family hydrolase